MAQLKHRHLFSMELDVDFAGVIPIGNVPAGRRRIAPVRGGSFSGDRLRGSVLPGADWVVHRTDGVMIIDVRLILKTDADVLIYLTYQGRFVASADAMARFGRGALLEPEDYSLAVVARLECGDPQLTWLNDCICVATGTQLAGGPRYEFFEIG